MDPPRDGYRLAIGALEVPQALHGALDELHASRFSADMLCLAGMPTTIEAMRPHGGSPLLQPLLDVEPLDFVSQPALVATVNRPMTTLKKAGLSIFEDGGQTPSECWLSPQFRNALLDRMLDGDVVLVAGPLSASQLDVGTRVLLRHSRHQVQSLVVPKVSRP